jgi:beta-mannosidase
MGELCAINDTDEPWRGEATVSIHHLTNGDRRQLTTIPFDVPARGVARLPLDRAPMMRPADRSAQFVVAQAGEHRALWFFEPDKKLVYPEPKFDASLDRRPAGYALTVRARTVLRDLCVFVDRLDPSATISDQAVTLLAGEEVTLEIATKRELTRDHLLAPPVFQCANRFGKKG